MAILSAGAQQWSGGDNTSVAPPAASFYKGDLEDETSLNAWFARERFPGVWNIGEDTFYEFTHAMRRTVIIAMDPNNVSHADEVRLREVAHNFNEEFFLGVVDGVAWGDELSDFNMNTKDLPAVLVTELELEAWVEDSENLRFADLKGDLEKMLAGAPLLWQHRGVMSKVWYYKRKLDRFMARGKFHTIIGSAGIVIALVIVVGILYCLFETCKVICEGPDMIPMEPRLKSN